ncbi:MAG: pyridoxal phosphate-dependent aminotransferase [Thermodesulfobacteriota bacterium]
MLAQRISRIAPSPIRRIFDLAATVKDPIDLSLGEPDFDVPPEVKAEAITWIERGFNKYTLTQGIPELRDKLSANLKHKGIQAEEVMVTVGATGGVFLSLLSLVNPGDEVLIPDPYFVMYPYLVNLLGGIPRFINTYPDFTLRPEEVERQITPAAQVLIVNSPNNPTGGCYTKEEVKALADIASKYGLTVISDDIYDKFLYDDPEHVSIGQLYENTVVLNGFSKSSAMTGWRLGYAAGPSPIIKAMINIQQFAYACPPSIAQKAALVALDSDISTHIQAYRKKRDLIYQGLKDKFNLVKPKGAFYAFPEAPDGDGTALVERAIKKKLFMVPGEAFSQKKSNFRLSFAAAEDKLIKAIEILNSL